MGKSASVVLFILVMIGVIVAVDFLLLRDRFWARLMTNIVIVVVFLTVYLRFLRHS